MDTGKTLPPFTAAWHLLSLTAVSMLLRTAGSHGLPQQATAPNWISLCIPAFLVVGLLENINCLSSGGLVTVKGVNSSNRMRKRILVKTRDWD